MFIYFFLFHFVSYYPFLFPYKFNPIIWISGIYPNIYIPEVLVIVDKGIYHQNFHCTRLPNPFSYFWSNKITSAIPHRLQMGIMNWSNKLTAIRGHWPLWGWKKKTEYCNNNNQVDRRPIVPTKKTKKKSEIDYIALACDSRSTWDPRYMALKTTLIFQRMNSFCSQLRGWWIIVDENPSDVCRAAVRNDPTLLLFF